MKHSSEQELMRLALRRAQLDQCLRLVYSGKLEGFLDSSLTLVVNECVVLNGADEVLRFMYTFDRDQDVRVVIRDDLKEPVVLDNSVVLTLIQNKLKERLGVAFDISQWNSFEVELEDSLRNECLAEFARMQSFKALREINRSSQNFWDWLVNNTELLGTIGHDVDSLLLLLGSFRGHPTHPSTKMKRILTPDDQRRESLTEAQVCTYSPEFSPDVELTVLAVQSDFVTQKISKHLLVSNVSDFFQVRFPNVFMNWKAALIERVGIEMVSSYTPIPVHPLQLPEVRHRFRKAFDNQNIIELAGVVVVQRPTLSFRTLTAVGRGTEPQVKTTLNIHMTSVVRTLAPSRAFNSTSFSDLLQLVVGNDDEIAQTLRPLPEIASVYWGRDPDPDSKEYKDGYQLGAIFKGNPQELLNSNEIRFPIATLLSPSPFSKQTILADIMNSAGVHNDHDAKAYFERYCSVVVNSDLGLLAKYGIGLESHQQNTDMVFNRDSGLPCATVYRDINGGMDIFEPLLKCNGYDVRPSIHPIEKGMFSTIKFPLQQTMHTTFASHLFPVVYVIADAFDVQEEQLFFIIKKNIKKTIENVRSHHLPSVLRGKVHAETKMLFENSLRIIEASLFAKCFETKGLLEMRAKQSVAIKFVPVSNPLVFLDFLEEGKSESKGIPTRHFTFYPPQAA